MIQKIKNLRKEVIRKVAQKIADVMVYRLQTLVDLEDNNELFHPKGLRIAGNDTILISE